MKTKELIESNKSSDEIIEDSLSKERIEESSSMQESTGVLKWGYLTGFTVTLPTYGEFSFDASIEDLQKAMDGQKVTIKNPQMIVK